MWNEEILHSPYGEGGRRRMMATLALFFSSFKMGARRGVVLGRSLREREKGSVRRLEVRRGCQMEQSLWSVSLFLEREREYSNERRVISWPRFGRSSVSLGPKCNGEIKYMAKFSDE